MTEPEEKPELPLLSSPRLPSILIETEESLNSFLEVLRENNKPIAIDAERASGFRYGQKAYLIQIAIQDRAIYLFDPVANYSDESRHSFIELVNEATWIIHAASQDIPCLNEMGMYPSKLVDTELAGRLLGLPKVSLGTLTEHYLGFSLAKEHSAVDWSTRPLPAVWLFYAALDVDVLFDLWAAVEAHLNEDNKLSIAQQEFEYLTRRQERVAKVERWRSVTGIHELKDQRQLTIVKHLWEVRENLAKDKDVAPGRLIPDGSIIAAVRANPKSRSELSSLRSFTGRASRTYIDDWWNAIQKGQTTLDLVELRPKSTGIPNHRNWPSKFPEANARFLWIKKLLVELSVEIQIPVENIVSPDTVKAICFEPPQLELLSITDYLLAKGVRHWQCELVAEHFLFALGQITPPKVEEEPKA